MSTPSITAQPNRGLAIQYEMGDGGGGSYLQSHILLLSVLFVYLLDV